MPKGHIVRIGFVSLLVLTGQGCVTMAPSRTTFPAGDGGDPVVAAAAGMLGAPYRYGGSTPRGFDCSGLVYYAHHQVGIPVPRTTGAQLDRARPVPLVDVRPGDVLFFELDGRKVSHVGIYAGAGNFIHAPSSGKSVSYASLRSAFWSSRLTGAGRFD
jgi:murein DD-endopeptidase